MARWVNLETKGPMVIWASLVLRALMVSKDPLVLLAPRDLQGSPVCRRSLATCR